MSECVAKKRDNKTHIWIESDKYIEQAEIIYKYKKPWMWIAVFNIFTDLKSDNRFH